MMSTRALRAITIISLSATAGTAAAQWCVQVQELPMLPTMQHAEARAVSRDGRVVVGMTNWSNIQYAFIWSREAGMMALPDAPGVTLASAEAVSDDGTVVAGTCVYNQRIKAFRWTAETGMVVLNPDSSTSEAKVGGITADGSMVVGQVNVTVGTRAFRWTTPGGFEFLADEDSVAWSVTGDGSRIAGRLQSSDFADVCYWDPAGDAHSFDLSFPSILPSDVTDDGLKWVGISNLPPEGETVIAVWTWGDPRPSYYNDMLYPQVYAVSADGTVIVGTGRDGLANRAMRWTLDKRLEYLFPDHQRPSIAHDVSRDGGTIVGSVTNTAGFRRAFVWTGRELGIDYTNDGMIDFFDYSAFVECFESGACPEGRDADFNQDGFVDFFDYDAYVLAFETGC